MLSNFTPIISHYSYLIYLISNLQRLGAIIDQKFVMFIN